MTHLILSVTCSCEDHGEKRREVRDHRRRSRRRRDSGEEESWNMTPLSKGSSGGSVKGKSALNDDCCLDLPISGCVFLNH